MPEDRHALSQALKTVPGNKNAKYLTFQMADAQYGIGLVKIREIIGMIPIAPVPQTPVCVRGVVNLRGDIIPIIDLRLRFGLPPAGDALQSSIIIVETTPFDEVTPVGVVVDSVAEVVHVHAADVQPPPCFGPRLNRDLLAGMVLMDDGVKVLLDIDRVLSRDELALLKRAA
jgi:purine-binding chemotaxis protein CheW